MDEKNQKMEEQLHLQFVALLLHDLESPLSVAKQFLRRVEAGRHDPNNPKHQQLAASTRLAIERAERILEDVLDQARNENTGLTAKKENTKFESIINSCLDIVSPIAENKSIRINKHIDSSLPTYVFIDPSMTSRVVDNYLVNAIRHTPRSEEIEINAHATNGLIRMEVINPLSEEISFDIQNIFDPSQQVQLRRQRKMQGSGLGLTYCRMAIKAQNGQVGANKKEDNKLVFWFELPLYEGESHG